MSTIKKVKISKRLSALSAFVTQGDVVADIGCDHAHLCCSLVERKIVSKAYACDVAQGPLLQAKKNIEYYKMEANIETLLCDGLSAIAPDVTCIIIAGMGFETVLSMLESHKEALQGRRCIVQVNRDVDKLRSWISEQGYRITDEKCILEDHYYQIVVFDTHKDQVLSEAEIQFGRCMERDFAFYSLWKFNLSKYEKILRVLDENHPTYVDVFSKMKEIYTLFGS